ncbi:MAG TPA: hypothetical protein VJY62_03755 [Bacteroidia bacterium]|nr:hypothetical protein [Bacteroidia bacterium]
MNEILGLWEKTTTEKCGEIYPDEIFFKENNLYSAQNLKPQKMHPVWDVGTYKMMDEKSIKISTSNDAVIDYAVKLENNILSFTDNTGCKINYKKRP